MKFQYNLNLIISTFIILNILLINHFTDISKAQDGNIIYVNDDGTEKYTSIQKALDDAQNDDTVFVYNGNYYENLVINKRVILIGEHKNTTIINGNNNGDVINITSDFVIISNFSQNVNPVFQTLALDLIIW